MKIALVYDRINKWGGAERVLLALHKIFPEAPIYTSVYSKSGADWSEGIDIRPSFLQKISQKNHEMLAPLMPIAFESFSFDEYDAVISVTSEAAKGIITKPSTFHLCICLTPTRYLWSGYDEYFTNPFSQVLAAPLVAYLRGWDAIAASRPDDLIAISEDVKTRIEKYYHRDSQVVYPPVTFTPVQVRKNRQKGEFFLVVSRLSRFTPYKRVDLAIKAANRLKVPLKIVGEVHDRNYFEELSGPTVELVGRVSDTELSKYYSHARALIFPGKEDFGLVMVEAQAHGIPVIAYRDGGAVEIVKEKITGEFFDRQTVSALVEKMENFSEKRYNSRNCIKNAQRFSPEAFEKKILEMLESKGKG